jgi:hypothetical protein
MAVPAKLANAAIANDPNLPTISNLLESRTRFDETGAICALPPPGQVRRDYRERRIIARRFPIFLQRKFHKWFHFRSICGNIE